MDNEPCADCEENVCAAWIIGGFMPHACEGGGITYADIIFEIIKHSSTECRFELNYISINIYASRSILIIRIWNS